MKLKIGGKGRQKLDKNSLDQGEVQVGQKKIWMAKTKSVMVQVESSSPAWFVHFSSQTQRSRLSLI